MGRTVQMVCLAVTEWMESPGAMAQTARMVLLVQMEKTERLERRVRMVALGLMAPRAKMVSAAQMEPMALTARQEETG